MLSISQKMTSSPVNIRPKYICITFSAQILHSNNKTLSENAHLFLDVPGALGQFWEILRHSYWLESGGILHAHQPACEK